MHTTVLSLNIYSSTCIHNNKYYLFYFICSKTKQIYTAEKISAQIHVTKEIHVTVKQCLAELTINNLNLAFLFWYMTGLFFELSLKWCNELHVLRTMCIVPFFVSTITFFSPLMLFNFYTAPSQGVSSLLPCGSLDRLPLSLDHTAFFIFKNLMSDD